MTERELLMYTAGVLSVCPLVGSSRGREYCVPEDKVLFFLAAVNDLLKLKETA